MPGYLVAQAAGALAAAWFLQVVVNVSARYGSTYPYPGHAPGAAFLMEAVLTLGLVSVILGTASGAQQVGLFGALGVGGYIALAGLWASPISGASMNPVRTLAPDVVSVDFTSWWVYLAGPAARRPAGRRDGGPAAGPRRRHHRFAGRPGHHQPPDQPARQGLTGRDRPASDRVAGLSPRRGGPGRRRARWPCPSGPRPGRRRRPVGARR